jgi:hypothetical protein
MTYQVILLLIFTLIVPLKEVEAKLNNAKELQNKYLFWTPEKRTVFHQSYHQVLNQFSKHTRYKDTKILEVFTTQSFWNHFHMISKAHANENFCIYGGWPSVMQAGSCLAPWSSAVVSTQEHLGPVYNRDYTCGGDGLFRCNPLVFGGPEENPHAGFCVETDDRDPSAAVASCLELMDTKNIEQVQMLLMEDPERMSQYFAIAAEVINFCEQSGSIITSCRELMTVMRDTSTHLASCVDPYEVYPYLPQVLTATNRDRLDEITQGLMSNYEEYLEELEERQINAREHNAEVIRQSFNAYSELPEVRQMNETLRENASRCLTNSCNGTRFAGRRTKNPNVSVAKCARYVKFGMLQPFLNSEYPDALRYMYAVHSHRWLEPAGFVNVLEISGLEDLTPENAPIGAVIVYERVGARRGEPGHIEVKTADQEYISDFITDEPTRLGGTRRVTGIFIKIPTGLEEQLVEVPEV